MNPTKVSLPEIVNQEIWEKARKDFLKKEKEFTRLRDQLNAERRRLPMVKIEKEYFFEGTNGKTSLLDLFEGRSQLIIYHFMFGPAWDEGCVGCSMLVDGIGHQAHLNASNVSLALVSRAPLEKIQQFKERMGWEIPWYSSYGSDFNYDFGVTKGEQEGSGHSVFLQQGDSVYRTYFTTNRGDEYLGNTWSYLDITPYGRQESWEDSPDGRPKSPPYQWWRIKDKY